MKISVVLFDGFELLDVFGPVELFSFVPGWSIEFVGPEAGLVASSQGVRIEANLAYEDLGRADFLLVPGGRGTRMLVQDQQFLGWLAKVGSSATYLGSVCTGSALLAAASLLEGYRATSNKVAFEWATSFGDNVFWQKKARWVSDGNRWTSSGISAGIDMAAAFIREREGDELAEQICARAELRVSADADEDPFAVG